MLSVPLSVRVERSGPDRVRVVVDGELDVLAAGALRAAAVRAARCAGEVEVDLHAVTFADSAGILEIGDALAAARATGARAATVQPSPAVRRVERLLAEAIAARDAAPRPADVRLRAAWEPATP